MIRVYLLSAWRSLVNNKFSFILNILGISLGLAASLLILQYISFELSYDRFNTDGNDIYRIYTDKYQNDKLVAHTTMTYAGVSKAMFAEFPEIKAYTRVLSSDPAMIISGDDKIARQRALYVENSFLMMFTYPLLTGDIRTSLSAPRTVVLTQSLAAKLFNINEANAFSILGKTIAFGNAANLFTITGVCKDVPQNSHLRFDLLLSYVSNSVIYPNAAAWAQADDDFTNPHIYHYIQLKPGVIDKTLELKLADFSQRHFQGNKGPGITETLHLQPLFSAHLYSSFEYEIGATASATLIWGLFVIAILILVIAWSNYVNLATAKSMDRAKEVGIRKVAGATKGQLIAQFMTESIIINLTSLIIAAIVILFFQNSFNALVNHSLSISYLFKKGIGGYSFSILLTLFILAGVFASGFYPSFILSSLKPILVLKGRFVNRIRGISMRKLLVISQFSVTAGLIACSLVVYKQLRFISHKELGFNISQILIINSPQLASWDSTLLAKENTFIVETQKIAGISAAAFSWSLPGEELPQNSTIRRLDQPISSNLTVKRNGISPGFIGLYQMKLTAGREFINTDFNSRGVGVHNLILNMTALKMLNFSSAKSAIGQEVSLLNSPYKIVGVIDDFHQQSLHSAIEPALFFPSSASPYSPFSLRVNAKSLKTTIEAIKIKYDAIFPGNLFSYYFLDDKFNLQYSGDQLFGKAFAIFSGLAIFIACLGLFGLSLFTAVQRTKEIGTRKVLGGSTRDIVLMLSKDFARLVLLAVLISWPIAWYLMHLWLDNFAYRTDLSLWIFFWAGLLTLIVAFLAIIGHAIKAASISPAKCLRSE